MFENVLFSRILIMLPFTTFHGFLSIFLENNEAGWKFWKKDKEESTTVTTTTLNSINVQSTITPINAGRRKITKASIISALNTNNVRINNDIC